ncbi:hypothetical protein SKTS_33800 [Sulfurimicrobium lacus]|uniref:Cupin type-2 domain-containing protein n=1 Tax=Sulfurimicrobium lacus TaxID=2715678 RepID=A0A6F8VFP0_9PROT|nr:hypothetical protein SKTS_33800 [Sulfurimicrobium lacus]
MRGFIWAICLLCLPLHALALEETAAVKVAPLLKTDKSWNGKSLAYPAGDAEITGLMIEIAPGGETGWHLHPVPSFGVILEGTLEVALKDGQTRRFQAGEAIAEVVDTLHNGRNIGTTPVRIVVFYAGAGGKALTDKEP